MRQDGEAYRRGRDVSASIGLVPRQYSSGGKDTLLGVSKRGDRRLRSLLVHGARAVVSRAERKDDPLSRRINEIRAERDITKLPPTEVGGLAHSVLMTNVIKLAPLSARRRQNMKIDVTV